MNCLFISSRIPDLIRNSKLVRFYFIPYILRDCLLKHHFPFGILPRSVSGMFLYCFLNINKCLSKFNCILFDGLTPNWHNCTLLCIGIRILMNWEGDGRLEANQETALAQVLAFEFLKTAYNFNSIILDVKVAKSRCLKVWQLSNNCTAYHYVVLSISLWRFPLNAWALSVSSIGLSCFAIKHYQKGLNIHTFIQSFSIISINYV